MAVTALIVFGGLRHCEEDHRGTVHPPTKLVTAPFVFGFDGPILAVVEIEKNTGLDVLVADHHPFLYLLAATGGDGMLIIAHAHDWNDTMCAGFGLVRDTDFAPPRSLVLIRPLGNNPLGSPHRQ